MRRRVVIDGHVLTGKAQGSRTVLARLLHGIEDEGFPDNLVLLSDDPDRLRADFPNIEHHALPSPSALRRLLLDMPRLLQSTGADVGVFTYIAPPFTRVKTVVFVHDVLPMTHAHQFSPLFVLRFSVLTWLTMVRAAAVLTISEASANSIRRMLPWGASKVHVVPLGPSFSAEAYRTARSDQGEPSKPYILAVGRIERRKNIPLLVEAFLKADLPDVNLVIAGSLDMGFDWRPPEDSRIHLKSGVSDEDLIKLYREAALFVFPSSAEGFGIPLLDATLFGLPVISSNLTSMPEVGRDLVTYFDPEESNAATTLANLIQGHFADHPAMHGSPTQLADQQERFSWRALAYRFAAIVDNV